MEIQSVPALKASLAQADPPRGLSPPLTALWYAAKTQFRIGDLVDCYKEIGQPFNGGGTILDAAALDYDVKVLSPPWCWVKAHTITQTIDYGFRVRATRVETDPSTWGDPQLNWVHGHLHRLESDDPNAAGWYKRGLREPSAVALPDEWESIAGELLAQQQLSPRSFATQLSPLAATLICAAPPLPLRFEPGETNPLTYHGETFARHVSIEDVCGDSTVVDEEHAVGCVIALYMLSGDFDEAHVLSLGHGSEHHPSFERVGITLKYLHAIIHRLEGPIQGELAGVSGHDNCEYWLGSGAGTDHPLLPRMGSAALEIGGIVATCVQSDGTGRWDPNAFNRLLEQQCDTMTDAEEAACRAMGEAELGLLLEYCHRVAIGDGEAMPPSGAARSRL